MRESKKLVAFALFLSFLVTSGVYAARIGRENTLPQPQSQSNVSPQRIKMMWKRFDDLLKQGKVEEAIQEANRLLSQFPNYASGYNNRGIAYGIKKNYDQAGLDFNKAISLNPQEPNFYSNRGWLYMRTDDIDKAISDFEQVVQINPAKPGGYNGLGWAYKQKGQYEQALFYFNKAIDFAPGDPQYRRGRAQTYAAEGKFDLAISDIDKCIEGNPEDPAYYSDRAYYHWMKGNSEQAIQDTDKAIQIQLNGKEAYTVRGLARWITGQKEEAIKDLKKAMELQSESPVEHLYLGYFSHEQGQKEEAAGYFSRALTLNPKIIEYSHLLGGLADAETTQDFYKKLESAAKMYRQKGPAAHDYELREEQVMGKDFVPVEVSILIDSVEIRPNPVPPGGDFTIKVKCLISDPSLKEGKIDIRFDYTIMKDDKIIRKKTQNLSVPVGKFATLKSTLAAGKTPGVYKIQVMLFHKEKIAGESANLEIEE